ncbi:MAG: DUF5063 domain-containing protein [Candidatus Thiodiazotropha sp. (ex Codakia rugifera)]|nr:DUF5063 domain-containing protein [Candidatus Thiodiazotropha sp. (ex Codakia rugifera)]
MEISEYLKEFSGLVRNFCNFCEQAPAKNGEERQALRSVAALYASAFLLQKRNSVDYAGPTVANDISNAIYKRFGSLSFNYYRMIDDPEKIPGQEPSAGDLADDLRDIYVDLKSGLSAFDAGCEEQAEEDWRTSFYLHWGQHAANVILVLNRYGAPNE